jgi:hypothetical protein
MRHELLHAEGDALLLRIEVEHHHVDRLIELDDFGGMVDTAPRQVGDVHQTVDTTEIDEHTEIGDRLDDTFENLPLLERVENGLALTCDLLFDDRLAADHDVLGLLVDLHDAHVERLAQVGVKVAHRTDVDLRSGKERIDAHQVHHDAALDATDAAALQDVQVVERALNLLPDAYEVGALARQDDIAVLVFDRLQKHLDHLADLQVGSIGEFLDGHHAFGLETDVDRDIVLGQVNDAPLDDLTLLERAQGGLIHRAHLVEHRRRVLELLDERAEGGHGWSVGRRSDGWIL